MLSICFRLFIYDVRSRGPDLSTTVGVEKLSPCSLSILITLHKVASPKALQRSMPIPCAGELGAISRCHKSISTYLTLASGCLTFVGSTYEITR